MPKKQKRPEAEVHAMILQDAKMRLGCADFAPDFTVYETRDPSANWDVHSVRNRDDWPAVCAEAFKEAPSVTFITAISSKHG